MTDLERRLRRLEARCQVASTSEQRELVEAAKRRLISVLDMQSDLLRIVESADATDAIFERARSGD